MLNFAHIYAKMPHLFMHAYTYMYMDKPAWVWMYVHILLNLTYNCIIKFNDIVNNLPSFPFVTDIRYPSGTSKVCDP